MPKAAPYLLAWSATHQTYILSERESNEALSFAFQGKAGSYTTRKESIRQGNAYWYAYMRTGEKLTKKYVGKTGEVTLARLEQAMECPLTLVSAPAGFGKTTLLSAWVQSFLQDNSEAPHVAWVSLDEGDNEPVLFWIYALTALDTQQPGLCAPLLAYLHMQQAPTPPLRYVLQALINTLASRTEQFLLVLDDYHLITEPEVHSSLTYLVQHLPPQLHIILATRADPPLPLSLLRAHGEVLEVRTNQLRCTLEEVMAFFKEVMGMQLPADII